MPGTALVTVLLMMVAFPSPSPAQELEAEVTLDRSRVSSASLNYLETLPAQVESYLNEYDWTNHNFQEHERIQVDIQITLLSVDNNYNFEASLVVRSQRPIYNSLQKTTLLLYNDENWVFHFSPNQSLIHDELQFSAFATLLDFYSYLVLGFDFDSFSELGGTPYFTEAQNLVSLAQTTSSAGWSRSGTNRRNRAQVVADLLSPSYEPLRRAIYVYHHRGIDRFLDNPPEARKQVIRALELIQEAKENTTNDLLFDTFFNAKYREITSILEDADPDLRLEAYTLLSEIDQSHLNEYEKLR